MREGYLPQMKILISTFILGNASYIPDEHHSHGHNQKKCHHLICLLGVSVFFCGFRVWGFFCMCDVSVQKNIFI